MAAFSGREFLIKYAGVAIACVRESSMVIDGSPVDITSKCDSGYRTLANFSGTESMEVTGSGVVTGTVMRDLALGTTSKLLTDVTLEYGDTQGGTETVTCDFFLASYTETGPHETEQTFEVTLQSSGSWVIS